MEQTVAVRAAAPLGPPRRLCASDHVVWRGKLPRQQPARHYVYIHIPKAGGASFMHDVPGLMPEGSTLRGSEEKGALSPTTLEKRRRIGGKSSLVILLRHPLKLAYSQYTYCASELHKGHFPSFDKWLSNFAHSPAPTSFHCYDPTNIQLRFTGGVAGESNSRAFGPFQRRGTCFSPERRSGIAACFNSARARLAAKFSFVGLTDLYTESLCLFRHVATGGAPLPSSCACGRKGPKHANITHGTAKHSLSDLSPQQLRRLAQLVEEDLHVYMHALWLFQAQARRIEEQSGVNIVCPAKLEAVWLDVVGSACALARDRERVAASLRMYGRTCPSATGLPTDRLPLSLRVNTKVSSRSTIT